MGRQITVEVSELVKNGCVIVPSYHIYKDEEWDDLIQQYRPKEIVSKYIVVIIHGEGVITSYCEDCLCFDCRNSNSNNYWVEEWLNRNSINYIAG